MVEREEMRIVVGWDVSVSGPEVLSRSVYDLVGAFGMKRWSEVDWLVV